MLITPERYSNNVFTLLIQICHLHLYFILFRSFYDDGGSYIGGYRQNKFHGKGEFEYDDGDREIAYWVDDNKEGKAKFYYKDGREEDRLYKDGKRVYE